MSHRRPFDRLPQRPCALAPPAATHDLRHPAGTAATSACMCRWRIGGSPCGMTSPSSVADRDQRRMGFANRDSLSCRIADVWENVGGSKTMSSRFGSSCCHANHQVGFLARSFGLKIWRGRIMSPIPTHDAMRGQLSCPQYAEDTPIRIVPGAANRRYRGTSARSLRAILKTLARRPAPRYRAPGSGNQRQAAPRPWRPAESGDP